MDPRPYDRASAHIFISPHLDDVVLSCAGRIQHLVHHGAPVMVMTVFAGDPPAKTLSPLAEWFHALYELGAEPVATRRREDLRAMKLLGAQATHVSIPDCLYRLNTVGVPIARDVGRVFTGNRRLEENLIATIVAELHVVAGHTTIGSIHVPLGIGRHVDHMTTRLASETFVRESGPARRPTIIYYEELPNAGRDIDPTWRYELVAGLVPEVHPLSGDAWERKLQAVRTYQSQLPVLRGPMEDLEEELRQYAIEIGHGKIVERIWLSDSRAW